MSVQTELNSQDLIWEGKKYYVKFRTHIHN